MPKRLILNWLTPMTKSKIIDLSWTLTSDMPLFPGDPAIEVKRLRTVSRDGYQITTWQSGMHVGTHLDAPSHFLDGGGDVAGIALDKVVGQATVIQPEVVGSMITTASIAKAYQAEIVKSPILLVFTGWETQRHNPRYFTEFYGFEPSLLTFLENNHITTFGVDMPSVKFGDSDFSGIHQALLSQGIVIVENLINLENVPSGSFFVGVPLKLSNFDGSMIRAIAIVDSGEQH
jgi:arylformamidase